MHILKDIKEFLHGFAVQTLNKARQKLRLLHVSTLLLCILLAASLAMLLGHLLQPVQSETNVTHQQSFNGIQAEAFDRGAELVVGVDQPIGMINPLYVANQAELDAVSLIFESLLQPDANGTYQGQLADSWAFDSASSQLVFTLQSGHAFQDGSAVNADDVVMTYQCLLSSSYDGTYQGKINQIESVGIGSHPSQVVFNLRNDVSIPDLSLFTIGIMQSDAYDIDLGQVYALGCSDHPPSGSGSFQLDSQQADEVILTRRSGYSGQVNQICFTLVDSGNVFDLLDSGYLDLVRCDWTERTQIRTETLEGFDRTHLNRTPASYFLVNPDITKTQTIKTVSQRLAVLAAVDVEPLDITQSDLIRQLAGCEISLYCFKGLDHQVYAQNTATAQSIAEQLRAFGLGIEVVALDWPDLASKASRGDYDILLLPAITSRMPDDLVVVNQTLDMGTTALVVDFKPEIILSSNRFEQLVINQYINPLAAWRGGWTSHIDTVRILTADGSYLED